MRDDETELYKKVFQQIPVRIEKMKIEVVKQYDGTFENKSRTLQFVVPVALVMILVFLSVPIFAKKDYFPLKVYAANGEYVQLGKEAISLNPKCEPYLMSYTTSNAKQKEDYSCVFYFDVDWETEEIKKVTYIIQGEKTASHIKEFSKSNVWFVEVSDREYKQNHSEYPFDYRYMESEGAKEVFTYLGSELVVDANKHNDRNYYIEYKIDKDEHGNLYAETFDIQVIIENRDGILIEKKLRFKPIFKMGADSMNGAGIVNELWVNVE